MKNPVPHIIANNHFWISPDRCLFWEEQNSLIVADLHLGKTGHFRKSGIAVPQSIYKADLQRLMAQLYLFKVDRLIIVGDFTHSTVNKELELFLKWRNDFSLLHIDLVKGNHDILSDTWYHDANIKVHEWELLIDGFCFRHEDKRYKKNELPNLKYTFTGHVHPSITLKGKGRQSLKFPCFYFAKEHCILPAFSRFTGSFKVQPEKGEPVFAISGDELMQVN
ncbi:MAG: ligase-associated DNA damage response endonuclease PdeM [Chitinophagaceae bacterium]|nr:ligase-associated DNA damage response endonuclease PdeM [Chitinophagaceae bacterium]